MDFNSESNKIEDLFRSKEGVIDAWTEVTTLLCEKYKMTDSEIGLVACILGHFAWHGIEAEFKIDKYLDSIEKEIRERGWSHFQSAILGTYKRKGRIIQ